MGISLLLKEKGLARIRNPHKACPSAPFDNLVKCGIAHAPRAECLMRIPSPVCIILTEHQILYSGCGLPIHVIPPERILDAP